MKPSVILIVILALAAIAFLSEKQLIDGVTGAKKLTDRKIEQLKD